MDGIVTEFVFEKPVRNPTSGFVGTIGCWTAGISVGVVAVAFALAGSMTIKLIGLVLLLVAGALCGLARTAPAIWKLRLTAACLSLGLMLLLAPQWLQSFSPALGVILLSLLLAFLLSRLKSS